MAKLSVTINNAGGKKAAAKRLETMARALVKDGTISPANRQILETEAEKLAVSAEELDEIIKRVLNGSSSVDKPSSDTQATPPPEPKVEDTQKSEPETPAPEQTSQTPETKAPDASNPPSPPHPDQERNIKPLIIAIALLAAIAIVVWLLCRNTTEPDSDAPTSDNNETTQDESTQDENTTVADPELEKLIKAGEDIFKTKNVARAKKMFQAALVQYPDNVAIKSRIAICDSIIKAAAYPTLRQERGTSPDNVQDKLGFADTNGYIVIDFLYDEEIDKQAEMMALKQGGNYGVVGGDLKEASDFKYLETLWIPSAKHYRLVTDQTGAAELASVQNGKLTIQQH